MHAAKARFSFVWKDYSRFVEVAPVAQGWLVLWGEFQDMGAIRQLAGHRTYLDLAGARRRVSAAVFELTHDPALVADALVLFDRMTFPQHQPIVRASPL